MQKFLDMEGLKTFKAQADATYLPQKGSVPITDKINLTAETKLSLAAKYAKVPNNSINFYIIADSSNTLPSSETRININSDIASMVGAEGANVGDIFVIGKLNLLPVYHIIPINDAKTATDGYKGTQGIVTPYDKERIDKVDGIENILNAVKNSLPSFQEGNMDNALATGVYPWCTLGRPADSTGAYTCITVHTTAKDSGGYDTIEQTAYGRQRELGRIFKRIIFKSDSDTQYGNWIEVTGGGNSDFTYLTATQLFRGGCELEYDECQISLNEVAYFRFTDSNFEETNARISAYSSSMQLEANGFYIGSLGCDYFNPHIMVDADMLYIGTTPNRIELSKDGAFKIVIDDEQYKLNTSKMIELGLLEKI